MRIRWMALLTLAALALTACAEDGGPAARVAEASTHTTDAQTARFSVTTELQGAEEGSPEAAVGQTGGEGEIDFANNRGRLTVQMPEVDGQPMADDPAMEMPESLESIFDGTVVYSQIPTQEGVRWLRIDAEELMADPAAMDGSNDPSAGLEMLNGADDVEEVGEDEVRGEPTTHFRATVDLEDAREDASAEGQAQIDMMLEQLGTTEMPVELWLDEEDRVRRLRYEIDMSQAQGADGAQMSGVMVTTLEFWDFGIEVEVEPPPEEEVVTMQELQEQQGMADQPPPEELEDVEGVEDLEVEVEEEPPGTDG